MANIIVIERYQHKSGLIRYNLLIQGHDAERVYVLHQMEETMLLDPMDYTVMHFNVPGYKTTGETRMYMDLTPEQEVILKLKYGDVMVER